MFLNNIPYFTIVRIYTTPYFGLIQVTNLKLITAIVNCVNTQVY